MRFLGVLFWFFMVWRGIGVVGFHSQGMYTVVNNKSVSGISGKAWVKKVLSKQNRKLARRSGPKGENVLIITDNKFSLAFILLLSGDVELNPGPTTRSIHQLEAEAEDIFVEASAPGEPRQARYERSAADPAILDALARIESGQAKMMENQIIIISRMDKMEAELKNTKGDVEGLKKAVFSLQCAEKDIGFLLDRQEQYSRKSSVRLFNVEEKQDERVEEAVITKLKEEIGVEVESADIDIVHRIGRREDDRPRAILVKFLCHKTKEKIMKRKREAKNIRIVEDLAPGIKRLFNYVNSLRSSSNLESVWTIDGRVKFKFCGNHRTFEIRCFADLDKLVTGSQ